MNKKLILIKNQNVPESMDELDEDVTLLKVSTVPIGIICQKLVNCIQMQENGCITHLGCLPSGRLFRSQLTAEPGLNIEKNLQCACNENHATSQQREYVKLTNL